MSLPPDQTTPVTEAVENHTNAVVSVVRDLSQHTEQLISDATRNGGADATAAELGANWARLWVAWINGATKITTTVVDNLALLTGRVARHWVSDVRQMPNEWAPRVGARYLFRVTAARTFNVDLPPRSFTLLDADDAVITFDAPGAVPVDGNWDRQFRVRPRVPAFTPGPTILTIQPVDATTAVDEGDPIEVRANIFLDATMIDADPAVP